MSYPIYMVGGSKGGVGKSIVAMTLVDYFQQLGQTIILVESDTSNPDVASCYEEEVETHLFNLDEADGWISLVNLCESKPENIVVINTPARNNLSVTAYGTTLSSTLDELKRRLLVLWVINRQRDSLELLRQFMEAIPNAHVDVIRNLHAGEEKKFELYNSSKTRALVEEKAGKSLNFPDLADRVSDDLYSRRLSIRRALAELPLGNRAELTRWRNEAKKMLDQLPHG